MDIRAGNPSILTNKEDLAYEIQFTQKVTNAVRLSELPDLLYQRLRTTVQSNVFIIVTVIGSKGLVFYRSPDPIAIESDKGTISTTAWAPSLEHMIDLGDASIERVPRRGSAWQTTLMIALGEIDEKENRLRFASKDGSQFFFPVVPLESLESMRSAEKIKGLVPIILEMSNALAVDVKIATQRGK